MNQSIEEIYRLADQKMKQLGFAKYEVKHRSLTIAADTLLEKNAFAEYWFLKENVFGVTVRSDYGLSGDEIPATNEVIIEHTGLVEIRNNTNKTLRVDFVQVLPINRD